MTTSSSKAMRQASKENRLEVALAEARRNNVQLTQMLIEEKKHAEAGWKNRNRFVNYMSRIATEVLGRRLS